MHLSLFISKLFNTMRSIHNVRPLTHALTHRCSRVQRIIVLNNIAFVAEHKKSLWMIYTIFIGDTRGRSSNLGPFRVSPKRILFDWCATRFAFIRPLAVPFYTLCFKYFVYAFGPAWAGCFHSYFTIVSYLRLNWSTYKTAAIEIRSFTFIFRIIIIDHNRNTCDWW